MTGNNAPITGTNVPFCYRGGMKMKIFMNHLICKLIGHTKQRYTSLYSDFRFAHCCRCGHGDLIPDKKLSKESV